MLACFVVAPNQHSCFSLFRVFLWLKFGTTYLRYEFTTHSALFQIVVYTARWLPNALVALAREKGVLSINQKLKMGFKAQ